MKKIILVLSLYFCCFNFFIGHAQNLDKKVLSKEELAKGVLARYEYINKDCYGIASLTLYKSKKYYYIVTSAGYSSYSTGKWIRIGEELVLNSDVKKNGLPVKIIYYNDSVLENNYPLQIVRNAKGEELSDALVYINNEDNQCLPLVRSCLGSYEKIDSLKIRMENGLSSNWIKIEKPYTYLQIILDLKIALSNYGAFENKKYKMLRGAIRELD